MTVDDRFNGLSVGDRAQVRHTITHDDIAAFVALTGDDNPLHVDAAYAARTSLRQPVVHGMLTASFISTLIGKHLPGEGALWYELSIRFLAPVRVGEAVTAAGIVRHKSPALRVLTLAVEVLGGDDRKVIEGEAKVRCMGPESLSAADTAAAAESAAPISPIAATAPGCVIVTGAARGIGAAVAQGLARAGHAIIVNTRSDADGAARTVAAIQAAGGRACAVLADVADPAGIDALMAQARAAFGTVAGIVNNASPPVGGQPVESLRWDQVQRHLDVQVRGALLLAQAAVTDLAACGGNIVSITSIAADDVPPMHWTAYTVAKAALTALSRSLAVELGPRGVRVNCVAPGMTDTDLIADLPEKAKMLAKAQTPLRRLATPDDVAGVVTFLFSDAARHLTGETIRVCGGLRMI